MRDFARIRAPLPDKLSALLHAGLVQDGGVNSPDIAWLKEASKRRRYLVAVSGGADSVALLHLLVEAGFKNLVVCHLDHKLRGRTSTADAKWVAKLAGKLGLIFEGATADVKQLMKSEGESLETAARMARHAFFAHCAREHRCDRVLLAHHAEDQAETVLWNLMRGSHGLKGMSEEHEVTVGRKRLTLIRPLLSVRKIDLIAWLMDRGIAWREDASNAKPIAVRNRLRNEVMPLLDDIGGRDVVAALSRGAADAAELTDFIDASVDQAKVLDPQGRLHLPTLRKLHPVLQRAAIKGYLESQSISDISRDLLDRALGLMDAKSDPAINLPGGSQLRRRQGLIRLRRLLRQGYGGQEGSRLRSVSYGAARRRDLQTRHQFPMVSLCCPRIECR